MKSVPWLLMLANYQATILARREGRAFCYWPRWYMQKKDTNVVVMS